MMWTIPTPWGPVSFHFCADEARMMWWGLVGAIPFLGAIWLWVRSKFKRDVKSHHACCHPKDTHD